MAQKGCFGLFRLLFGTVICLKVTINFTKKNIFAKKLAQAKTFDPKFGHLGNFSISFTT